MIIKNENMIVFYTIAEWLLNISLAWLCTLAIFQNLDKEIFELLINGTPSTIAQYLGFLYLIFLVAKKGIEVFHYWEMKRMERKEKKTELKNKT